MKHSILIVVGIIIIAVIGLGIYVTSVQKEDTRQEPADTETMVAQVQYMCENDAKIDATFYEGGRKSIAEEGQPPTPTGNVSISLSDGRTLRLPRTLSASGIRYSNDENFMFWSKGNTAFITEGGENTFSNCIKVSEDSGTLSETYYSNELGFTIRYPEGHTASKLSSETDITSVQFIIPEDAAEGTNLSSDSYVAVAQSQSADKCTANLFLEGDTTSEETMLKSGDMTYSVASSSEAGAGNRYEDIVYAIPGTQPCTAVQYFIHYTVLENYPEGTVTAFDTEALMQTFDEIRDSLILAQ